MAIMCRCMVILYCLIFFCFFCVGNGISSAHSMLTSGQAMRDYDFMVSPNQLYKLLFFSPKFSPDFTNNRYLVIHYINSFDIARILWVANPENPLTDTSGSLNITQEGYMVITDNKGTYITLNSKQPAAGSGSNMSVSLLDSGNLVLRSGNQILWQSFDYFSDTLLPGMKLGIFGLKTGKPRTQFLTSWINQKAPAAGAYTLGINPNNTKQLVIWRRGIPYWRSGIWKGKNFSYFPYTELDYLNFSYVSNENESYYTISPTGNNPYVWIGMNSSGSVDILTENYGWAGPYLNCNDENEDSSQGCIEPEPSSCRRSGHFILRRGIIGGEWDYVSNFSLVLSDCKEICKRNCSCTAYFSIQSDGAGCMFSQGRHIDLLDNPNYPVFYLRNGTDIEKVRPQPRKRRLHWLIIGGPMVSLVLCLLSLLWYLRRRNYCCFADKKRSRSRVDTEQIIHELGASLAAIDKSGAHKAYLSGKRGQELPLFSFSSIQVATDHFSDVNKLGQGGFGPVYKGKLVDGEEIAVKRLSRRSGKGLQEFKNEVMLISKLQHRNLVRVIGCCIKGEERILIYEYLPNKSLDYFLFDATKRALLDWEKRLCIIEGIAQGLIYLHKYSRLKIIHRDLKISNILLDSNMNPKISNFGTARIFGEDESRANTNRIVGTYGYMSPEYAMDGLFSVKSDVFSFGVMMLEIVSGKKNIGFYHSDRSLNLLGYAWDLWKEGKCSELMDKELLDGTCSSDDATWCVQVSLLCVQESAADRPTMSDVLSMLSNELGTLPTPKQPAFSAIFSVDDNLNLPENPGPCSVNDVTFSEVEAR